MRRRAGADAVDIDTREGTVAYALVEPQIIDFDAIEQAAYDAGYTLMELKLEIEGELESNERGTWLVVPATRQRFELTGSIPHSGLLRVVANVQGWAEDRVRLTVVGHEHAQE